MRASSSGRSVPSSPRRYPRPGVPIGPFTPITPRSTLGVGQRRDLGMPRCRAPSYCGVNPTEVWTTYHSHEPCHRYPTMMSCHESNSGNSSNNNAGKNNGSVYWDVEAPYTGKGKSPWVRRGGNPQSPNDGSPTKDGVDMEMQGLIFSNCPGRSSPNPETKSQSNVPLLKRLRFHFIRFCETTSLRGIPRIVKTKDRKRKCLWATFVLTFFAGAIACNVFLALQYLQYDVIHQPRTILNSETPFPSFTICNTHPLSVEGKELLKKLKVSIPSAWVHLVVKKAKKYRVKVGPKFNSEIHRYLGTMFGLHAWLQALPDNMSIASIGQAREEMILKCTGNVLFGDDVLSFTCDQLGVWVHTVNMAFVNCYSFTVFEKFRNWTTNLDINIYLGESTRTCDSCMSHLLQSQVEGVRVQVHGAGTYPKVDDGGLYLMPGTLTEIRFSTREWHMMEPPHGTCQETLSSNNITLMGSNFTFSKHACMAQATQEAVADKCGCVDFGKPISSHLSHFKTKRLYCRKVLVPPYVTEANNFTFNHDEVVKHTKIAQCAVEIQNRMDKKAKGSKCPSPCIYYTYESSVSSSRWPSPSYHASFRNDIERKFIFHGRQNLIRRYKHVNSSATFKEKMKIYDKLEKHFKRLLAQHEKDNTLSQYFEKRFLALQLSRPNFDIERVEEKAVISLTSFLSQVGGLLSIWVGLTFVCIVEVIELFLNIADTFFASY